MSIHTELLRMALEADVHGTDDASTDELVARLLGYRRGLRDATSGHGRRAADTTAELIAHDVALVRLCERLGIDQDLTDPQASPIERDRLVAALGDAGIDLGEHTRGPVCGDR